MSSCSRATNQASASFGTSHYSISYSLGSPDAIKVVKSFTIAQLFSSYGKILWEEGKHKGNVKSFLGEIDEILLNQRV